MPGDLPRYAPSPAQLQSPAWRKPIEAPAAVGVLMIGQPAQAAGDGGFGQRRAAFLRDHLDPQPRIAGGDRRGVAVGPADAAFERRQVGQIRRVVVEPQFAGVLSGGEQHFALPLVAQVGLARQRQVELGQVVGRNVNGVAAFAAVAGRARALSMMNGPPPAGFSA